jgi:hypothetical protein
MSSCDEFKAIFESISNIAINPQILETPERAQQFYDLIGDNITKLKKGIVPMKAEEMVKEASHYSLRSHWSYWTPALYQTLLAEIGGLESAIDTAKLLTAKAEPIDAQLEKISATSQYIADFSFLVCMLDVGKP